MTIVTTKLTIEPALGNLPSSIKGPLPDLSKTALEHAEEADMLLVRLIEWTVVEADTYDGAGTGKRHPEVPASVCACGIWWRLRLLTRIVVF